MQYTIEYTVENAISAVLQWLEHPASQTPATAESHFAALHNISAHFKTLKEEGKALTQHQTIERALAWLAQQAVDEMSAALSVTSTRVKISATRRARNHLAQYLELSDDYETALHNEREQKSQA